LYDLNVIHSRPNFDFEMNRQWQMICNFIFYLFPTFSLKKKKKIWVFIARITHKCSACTVQISILDSSVWGQNNIDFLDISIQISTFFSNFSQNRKMDILHLAMKLFMWSLTI
jgi:hypothetical protein